MSWGVEQIRGIIRAIPCLAKYKLISESQVWQGFSEK